VLSAEWQNLQAVMDWCMAEGRYSEALQLWQNLEAYTQFRGRNMGRFSYSSDRLIWTKWLMQMAEQRGEWRSFLQMILAHAWTLSSIGQPALLEEAEEWLAKVWDLRHHEGVLFQANIAQSLAVLHIKQRQFDEAKTWLDEMETLLNQFFPGEINDDTKSDNTKYNRFLTRLSAYRGRIFFEMEIYPQAREQFTIALERARQLHWLRTSFIMQSCLAEVAIAQGQLDEAQVLLIDGLHMAEVNHDRTHLAYNQRAIAKLAQAQGNIPEAICWTIESLENFEMLNMDYEVEATHDLLMRLESSEN
jgi:tetratricopeptide (TPR) repeat protein